MIQLFGVKINALPKIMFTLLFKDGINVGVATVTENMVKRVEISANFLVTTRKIFVEAYLARHPMQTFMLRMLVLKCQFLK